MRQVRERFRATVSVLKAPFNMRLTLWLLLVACGRENAKPEREPAKAVSPPPVEVQLRKPPTNIEAIDWYEATYLVEGRRIDPARARNSSFSHYTADLIPGGTKEALVVFDREEGRDYVTDLWVFGLRNGRVEYLTSVMSMRQPFVSQLFRDRVDGTDIVIHRLVCRVASADAIGSCPREVQVERWRWNGERFVEDVSARTSEVP